MTQERSTQPVKAESFALRSDAPLTQYIRSFSANDVSATTRAFYTEYRVNIRQTQNTTTHRTQR